MNRLGFWLFSLALFLLLGPLCFPAWAESEIDTLRKEVRELKTTVKELGTIVQKQNQRIEELSEQKVSETTPPSIPEPPVKSEREKPRVPEKKEPAKETMTAEAMTGDQEIDSLLQKVDQAPSPPGAASKSIGFWRVPTGPSVAAKLIPDISAIALFSGAYFSQEPTGETGHDPARTGFTFQEIELALQSVIDPYFRYDIFLSFSEEGVEIEEGYFTTLGAGLPKGLQFKGGKFLLPFGRQNPKHLEFWDFADNNLVNKYLLGPEGLNELGLELSYLFPTPVFFQFQGTFTNGDNDTSFGGNRKGDFLYQGRLSTSVDVTENLVALVGASAAFGFNGTGSGNRTVLYGGDFLLKWKPSAYRSLVWQTEYIFRQMQTPGDNFTDGGLYSYIDYQFLKRWHAGFRYDQMGLPVGLVASEFRLTPAITFNPSEFSRIRMQYEYDKIAGLSGSHAGILQFEFSMGPHGAHPF